VCNSAPAEGHHLSLGVIDEDMLVKYLNAPPAPDVLTVRCGPRAFLADVAGILRETGYGECAEARGPGQDPAHIWGAAARAGGAVEPDVSKRSCSPADLSNRRQHGAAAEGCIASPTARTGPRPQGALSRPPSYGHDHKWTASLCMLHARPGMQGPPAVTSFSFPPPRVITEFVSIKCAGGAGGGGGLPAVSAGWSRWRRRARPLWGARWSQQGRAGQLPRCGRRPHP
jgi:hypothetical protein